MRVENRRIEYIDLTIISRWPRNPKEHDLGAIYESIRKHGFVGVMTLDETSGKIVEGHGRLTVLQQMKAGGEQVPTGILTDGGKWRAPVQRGIYFDSEREAESYVIAANQTTMMGGWDVDVLTEALADLGSADLLAGTGFDGDDLDKMLKQQAEDIRASYEFLGSEAEERDGKAEERARFPLAIVLTRDQLHKWQAYKDGIKVHDDGPAFLRMLEERADGG